MESAEFDGLNPVVCTLGEESLAVPSGEIARLVGERIAPFASPTLTAEAFAGGATLLVGRPASPRALNPVA